MGSVTWEVQFDLVEQWYREAAPGQLRAAVEKGLYRSALAVMARSQEIVPIGGPPTSPRDVAPGTLRASGTVLLPEWEGTRCVVVLGYGGAAEEYAWVQHEDLSFRHKAGQQAKYLETPLDQDVGNVVGRISDAMKEA